LQNFITKGFDVKESDTNRNLRYWIKRESVWHTRLSQGSNPRYLGGATALSPLG
jgi:hypothetical protein